MNMSRRNLTERKRDIFIAQGYIVTGYVLRNDVGDMVIVEQSAVRKLDPFPAWELMHPGRKENNEPLA